MCPIYLFVMFNLKMRIMNAAVLMCDALMRDHVSLCPGGLCLSQHSYLFIQHMWTNI